MMRSGLAAGLAAAAVATGAASSFGQEAPKQPGPDLPEEAKAALALAYLKQGQAPNSLRILPPPPAAGSPDQARDDAAAKAATALRGGPRWDQAVQDADLSFTNLSQTFACAADLEISQAATPRTYRLMQRSMVDIGLSTYPTKTKYQRARPFTVNKAPLCTPDQEAFLRGDGSYPSGHSAVGWGLSLILAEAAPDRAEAILARGRAFGQSRVVCNVHWLSDTEEGRVMAAATVARLHGESQFRADLDAARTEIAAARAKGARPARDCAIEASRLAG